ncbi:MAG TPA: hypothetical protein PLF54_06735 [Deltaproteobacteria bacterium]|nr:hypothetical protein [Deltaproteobacteria bacterium]HQJ08681.1 hypothetical protein [Deltaproteobacteria bacterium]
MHDQQSLIQRSIHRTRHSLPFLDPSLRDLITLLPLMLSEGELPIGIYGNPIYGRRELEFLKKYLGRKPHIAMRRLPYRTMVESLIVLVRPSLSSRYHSTVTVICIAKKDAPVREIDSKLAAISDVFRSSCVPFAWLISNGTPLPELLVYEIMLTGIVAGGKQPAQARGMDPDLYAYIGDLPGKITRADLPETGEWNPFRHYLEEQIEQFVSKEDYPSVLSIPSANPFIIPYLHILHRLEESMNTEQVEKMRMSLLYLFSAFPPTRDAIKDLMNTWRIRSSYTPLKELSFEESLRLRKWLVPLEENELPVFSFPPPPHFPAERLELKKRGSLWGFEGIRTFSHEYPWVVLVWAAAAGLIGRGTRVIAPQGPMMRRGWKDLLLHSLEALRRGTDILVPDDHSQGSLRSGKGRIFFHPAPFAILGEGQKYSLALFEDIKKKTLIDDTGLKRLG